MRAPLEFAWNTSHPTLEVLRRRREEKSQPGSRLDGERVALLVEGGGMRGVTSGAMLSALDDLGYKNTLDAIYGYSAGAVNAAYFLAGDTWFPLSIYYDHLASRRFVDFLRPLRRLPIMNLSFAFDVVADKLNPLDYQRVCESPIPLTVAISMVDTQRPELIDQFRSPADLREALVASCWLPFAIAGTARFRDRPALDGGVLMPSMLKAAEDAGATRILSLRTRSTPVAPERNGIFRIITSRYLEGLQPGLGRAYLAQRAALNSPAERTRVSRAIEVGPLPSHARLMRHETDPNKVLRAARNAYAAMYALLEQVPLDDLLSGRIKVIPRLTVWRHSAAPGTADDR